MYIYIHVCLKDENITSGRRLILTRTENSALHFLYAAYRNVQMILTVHFKIIPIIFVCLRVDRAAVPLCTTQSQHKTTKGYCISEQNGVPLMLPTGETDTALGNAQTSVVFA